MISPFEFAVLLAVVGSGLVAGLCFAFATFIMRAFDRLGSSAAIRAMQAINATILRSLAMGVWFGTALAGGLTIVLAHDRTLPVLATTLYVAGAVAITGRGNVPLNEALDLVDPDGAQAEARWRDYRLRWGRFNNLRTVLCAAASGCFALAL